MSEKALWAEDTKITLLTEMSLRGTTSHHYGDVHPPVEWWVETK